MDIRSVSVIQMPTTQISDEPASGAPASDGNNEASLVQTTAQLDQHPCWYAVQRVVTSAHFSKSHRLSTFLLYVAERSLLGRESEVTEQQIGVHVFGRPASYNPSEDNIVRQTARLLRHRLALFYQEEGRDETINISIPRGGYIVQFQPVISPVLQNEGGNTTSMSSSVPAGSTLSNVAEDEAVEHTEDTIPLTVRTRRWDDWRHAGLILCLGLTIGALGVFGLQALWGRHSRPRTSSDKFWRLLLPRNQKTLVVVGDAGLNMYTNLARAEVDVEDYAKQNYLHTPGAEPPPGVTWEAFARRRYVALTDLAFVTKLSGLPGTTPDQFDVRFARDIHFSDLENSTAILIGGPNYNPWVHAFDKNADLYMQYDGSTNNNNVINRKPASGEKTIYTQSPLDPERTGYALVLLADNVQGTGRVLVVEGTGMGGVGSAIDFLFNPGLMDPVIREVEHNHRISNFDLLLETTFYTGGNMRAKVIALHPHPTASN